MANQKIFTVLHPLQRGTTYAMHLTDLIFEDEQPFLVLSWTGTPDSEVPEVKIALDPSRLSKTSGSRPDYVYDGPIEDPRKLD